MEVMCPNIHLIETPYGKYFYDVNTDEIYSVKNVIFESLKKLLNNQEELIDKSSMIEIKKMKNNGLLKNNRPQKMQHPALYFMDYYLNHKLESITLQLTQNCNFRCKYCIYGQHSSLNRSHSSNRMTFDIAQNAVNFLLGRSRDAEVVNIGFFGGEPLLEFNLLRKVVLYAEKVFLGKPLTFNLTTNCSLINDEMVDFLSSHSIHILISLDGPKNIHDNKRVFAVNGCGTFDVIMEKLVSIQNKYPDYYKNFITFNTVIDPSKEFDCINQMYINNALLKDSISSMYNLIDDSYSVEKNKYSEAFTQQRSYEEFKILLYELGRIQEENLSVISRQRSAQELELKKTLGNFKIYDEMSHGGPCIIGRRTFVNTKGILLPCERVSESSAIMQIGDIHLGFDLDKVNKLMNVAKVTEDQCKECWAITRCHMCAKHADNGDSLCAEKILQGCNNEKYDFEYRLKRHIAINEIKAGGII